MAYTPTEWETGDVITAVKLNNMEQGIEDAFVAPAVTISDEGDVLTVNSSGAWAAAAPASQLPAVTAADQGKVLAVDSSGDWVAAVNSGRVYIAEAEIQNDVPVVTEGDLDDAIAAFTAGHPVIMTLTNPGGVLLQLHGGMCASGSLFMIGYSAGAGLQLIAFTWSSSGLTPYQAA